MTALRQITFAEHDYIERVRRAASLNPALLRVLDYITPGAGSLGMTDHDFTHAALIEYPEQSYDPNAPVPNVTVFEGRTSSLQSLRQAIIGHTKAAYRLKTIVIQDIQPHGVLSLGNFLSVDPNLFEHYLNRDASFETFDSNLLVFDYPESFLYADGLHAALPLELFHESSFGERGNLVKVWMNIYAYNQRIVLMKLSQQSGPDIELLLIDSLPRTRHNVYHLASKPPSLWTKEDFGSSTNGLSDSFAQLLISLTRQSPDIASQPLSAAAVTGYLSYKWQVLLYYAQVRISESKAPLSGDVQLVTEVIQRKHDFEKMQRTMMANLGSAKILPGVQPDSKELLELQSFQKVIAGWATQLEKVNSSLSGLLAISESVKASKQAVRTQNLTILAFVFIPISTVSSIYGMNTVEIAQNNPHMWQFGMSAAITTILAIFIAWSYRFWETLFNILFSPFQKLVVKSERKATHQPPNSPSNGFSNPLSTIPDNAATSGIQIQPPLPSTGAFSGRPSAMTSTTAHIPAVTDVAHEIDENDVGFENDNPTIAIAEPVYYQAMAGRVAAGVVTHTGTQCAVM